MSVGLATRGVACPGTPSMSIATRGVICLLAVAEEEVRLNAPIHITSVTPGMVLRIAMKPGRHLDPVVGRTTIYRSATIRRQQGVVFPEPPTVDGLTKMQTAVKRKRTGNRARGFSRTTFMAYVSANDPVNGILNVYLESRAYMRRPGFQAVIAYSDMLYVQRAIHRLTPRPEAGSRPGSIAFGSTSDFGFQKLVPVYF